MADSKIRLLRSIRESHFGRMIINAGWLGLAMPFTVAAGIIKAGLLARILGKSGLGTYGIIISITGLLTLVLGFTSAQSLITFANKYIQDNNDVRVAHLVRYCFIFDILCSFFAYTALLILSSNLTSFFHLAEDSKAALIVYGLIIILQATLASSISVLHLFDFFKYDFIYKTCRSWILLGVIYILYRTDAGLFSIIVSEVAVTAVSCSFLFFVALKLLKSKGIHLTKSGEPWWRVSRQIWRFQFLAYLRGALKGLHSHLGVLLLGYMTSTGEVGLFYAAKRISDPIRNTSGFFSQSLYPIFGRLWFSERYDELKRLFKRSAYVFIVLGVLVLAFTLLFIKEIITLIFGAPFNDGSPAAVILLISAALVIIVVPLNALLPATGRNEAPLMAATIRVVTQTAFILIFVPSYGATGAAASFLGAFLLGNLLFLFPRTISLFRKVGTNK